MPGALDPQVRQKFGEGHTDVAVEFFAKVSGVHARLSRERGKRPLTRNILPHFTYRVVNGGIGPPGGVFGVSRSQLIGKHGQQSDGPFILNEAQLARQPASPRTSADPAPPIGTRTPREHTAAPWLGAGLTGPIHVGVAGMQVTEHPSPASHRDGGGSEPGKTNARARARASRILKRKVRGQTDLARLPALRHHLTKWRHQRCLWNGKSTRGLKDKRKAHRLAIRLREVAKKTCFGKWGCARCMHQFFLYNADS